MKTYTLFWLSGESEIVKGNNLAEAMTLSGYGAGALGALDFYSQGLISYMIRSSAWFPIPLM